MGKVLIQPETTKDPISLIGREAGLCWGADIKSQEKNYKRGLDCINAQHGRTWEFPEVYLILDGYSARVIREFYTHIGGAPTRLQESTRYVDCTNFEYVIPPKIANNVLAEAEYVTAMEAIMGAVKALEQNGLPREDAAMLLPLGMKTKVAVKMNLRTMVSMANQRLCTRAFWEFRELMRDLKKALSEYSIEWEYLISKLFIPKCEVCGFCTEKFCCGRAPRKDSLDEVLTKTISLWDQMTEEQHLAFCKVIAKKKQQD